MIQGYVEMLCEDFASGWCADTDNPEKKLAVTALYDGKPLASIVAERARKDLAQFGDDGKFAFHLKFPGRMDMGKLEVVVEDGENRAPLPVLKTGRPRRGYQTFNDQCGDSDSSGKLSSLHLPYRMEGKSVLDLGCNEGFFCIDALARGASRVVGIDASPDFIKLAKSRNSQCEYICGSWWDMPDEKFDFVYLLSAIHYEADQKQLLDRIADHLADNGLLFLECGIDTTIAGQAWVSVQRGDGVFRFPTREMLVENLLASYYVRFIGQSVNQPGDPVKRYVFHCAPKKPVCILVKGEPNSGKTVISTVLAGNSRAVRFSIDDWIGHIRNSWYNLPEDNAIFAKISTKCDLNYINKFIDGLTGEEAVDFADALFSALPLNAPCMLLEGYALNREDISGRLYELLTKQNVRTWTLNPGNEAAHGDAPAS